MNVQLESCTLFLLLISPNYLASNYCLNIEMKRALERNHAKTARVVPIILEPCDWKSTQLSQLKALPQDGKPVSNWKNKNEAYLDVVNKIRIILNTKVKSQPIVQGKANIRILPDKPSVKQYNVKRDFDEIDRSDFRNKAFRTIRNYFQHSVEDINTMENLKGRFNSLSDTSFSCTIINKNRNRGTAHITVHVGGMFSGGISYSFQENAPSNSANGWFTVEADEYDLYLNPMMAGANRGEKINPNEVAELLWKIFLEQAGITFN
ncbi:MAG: TIR domain-containing protein [Rhodobacteraceae bacterium]|nr:TIR domain-containing protein [Paracoccaceae bacterium]